MKAVNKVMFDVSRALISAISSMHHFIRSHVTLLLEPRLSYFLTRSCRSFSTLLHPPKTTLSRAALAGGGGGTRRVSSDSLSTACNDRTSPLILRKLSVDPLPILDQLCSQTQFEMQASCRESGSSRPSTCSGASRR